MSSLATLIITISVPLVCHIEASQPVCNSELIQVDPVTWLDKATNSVVILEGNQLTIIGE